MRNACCVLPSFTGVYCCGDDYGHIQLDFRLKTDKISVPYTVEASKDSCCLPNSGIDINRGVTIVWNRSSKSVDVRQLSNESLSDEVIYERHDEESIPASEVRQLMYVDTGAHTRHGDFLVVPYEGAWYLAVVDGMISDDDGDEIVHVNCLAPAGPSNKFWWPERLDKGEYPPNEIICKLLQAPVPDCTRRQLRFNITNEIVAEICCV